VLRLRLVKGAFDGDREPVGEASPVGLGGLPGAFVDRLFQMDTYGAGCHKG